MKYTLTILLFLFCFSALAQGVSDRLSYLRQCFGRLIENQLIGGISKLITRHSQPLEAYLQSSIVEANIPITFSVFIPARDAGKPTSRF